MSSKTTMSSAITDQSLSHENQMLSNELIVINQSFKEVKSDLKQKTDALKRSEKERNEAVKGLEIKENTLKKLRKERDELWSSINTDKFKSFKSVEEEKNKF